MNQTDADYTELGEFVGNALDCVLMMVVSALHIGLFAITLCLAVAGLLLIVEPLVC